MKKLQILLFTLMAIALLSCTKDQTKTGTTVEISVVDGSTGSAAAGATVSLYESSAAINSNTPKYTQTTDQTGKAKIGVAYLSQYYVTAQLGSKKNYYNGFLPVGIFKTQTDIQNSAIQTPAAVIGSVKFQDTNGDGKISAADDVAAPSVSLTVNTNTTFTTTVY
ncbi:hypothetical protein KXD93_25275 [Mucilaginibacter sp. BJC16-A38]|uniref:hypothetical protein n=1 Tax=Mucilaginibacter phenanthrenivorans TaxID=1234842 RepID=UPI002157C330|nr:hypothetical protein [Mucilaginibacter phenanthrenivorans]MCR8560994.1 hypothetical protein [Mucilaginibacter phenanthrenivorans]